jgi:Lrp/AsnC family transcriptional regulator, regulator for asnA, asnC and gidA
MPVIDELDTKIIRELRNNCRCAFTEIAKRLGVVEGTVRKRVSNLLGQKLIKLTLQPNLEGLGYSFITILGAQVRMADLQEVAESLALKKNICYLAFVTGRYDLMAIVITRSPEELAEFIKREISDIPSIIRTESFVNLEILKGESGALDTSQLTSTLGMDFHPTKKR